MNESIMRRLAAEQAYIQAVAAEYEADEPERRRADQLSRWLDQLEAAAGFGPLADVAAHLRGRLLDRDHEMRLRAKRVEQLRATVLEESEWRQQVLHEWQERAERAEAERDRLREFARVVAEHGLSADLQPTINMRTAATAYAHLTEYLQRLDDKMRARARRALDQTGDN